MTNYEADEAAMARAEARDQAVSYHPQPSEYEDETYTFTITGTFKADSLQEAWDQWVEWVRVPFNLEDHTVVQAEL